MPRVLCDTATRWLEDLPPYEQGSKDVQGTLHAIGMEIERIEAAKDRLRANFWPQSADELALGIYEQQFGVSVNPADKTVAQRRVTVLAEEKKILSDGSGLSWQENLTDLIGTGWSYREHDPADGTSPPVDVILVRVPYAPLLPVPTGMVLTDQATGSLSGTYVYGVTATNFWGETTLSATQSITVAAGRKVKLDWTAVAGATGYNVYGGPTVGSMNRIASVATNTYTDLTNVATGGPAHTVNTTESYQAFEAKALARKITPAHVDLNFSYGAGWIVGTSRLGDAL